MSKLLKSPIFWICCVFVGVIIFGTIFYSCKIDSLKENNNKLLQQLLVSSDYQAQKLSDTVSGIKTLETNQISADIISEELQKVLNQSNLSAIYASQIQLQASISKVLDGQAGATTAIPRPSTAGTTNPSTTTIIVRDDNHDNNSNPVSNPSNCSVPSNNQPTTENISACNQCLSNNIIRVPFEDHSDPLLSIAGYTESGPAINANGTYHLEIKWLQDILLSIALAQDESGAWTTLIDSNSPNIDISRIRSEITIEPFERKWYQNVTLGLGLGFGKSGILLNGALGYRIDNNFALAGNWWYIMPFSGEISDYNSNAFYGASLTMNL
jgi:hypothetical protein